MLAHWAEAEKDKEKITKMYKAELPLHTNSYL